MSNGTLYICPTPIGNLEDITLRALRILKEVDIIACEDTRVTQKLLNHYEINTKTISYHKFSEKQKSSYLSELLKEGKNIALVSDAGTPVISDPGSELLKVLAEENINIVSLAGACALTVAVSSVYLEKNGFMFAGFLPKKDKEIEELLLKYKTTNLIIYEAPSRLIATLKTIDQILDNPNVVVARELTKFYEEVRKDTAQNLIDYYESKGVKGEIVLIIEGKDELFSLEDSIILEKAKKLKKEGFSTKDISKIISILENISKSQVYNLIKDL
ncbi:MAG: 16S rRNA (cytidine(1402)-2'-O)-methyltransferase [bacterium]